MQLAMRDEKHLPSFPRRIDGGTATQRREKATVLPWNDLSPLADALD
jgi:hypothetical protein